LQLIEEYIVPIHDEGILHGDLKPANIIFGEKAKPIDFGDSKRTDTQTLTTEYRGTFGYAMDMGEDITREHDYYALAQVAKFLMTKEQPLHFPTERSRDAYNEEEFGELDISDDFKEVLMNMVTGKYDNVHSLVSDLRLDDVVEDINQGSLEEQSEEINKRINDYNI